MWVVVQVVGCLDGKHQDNILHLSSTNITSLIIQTQCKTEHLEDGGKDTFPVATDLCSALCWGEDTNTVTDCPNSGAR